MPLARPIPRFAVALAFASPLVLSGCGGSGSTSASDSPAASSQPAQTAPLPARCTNAEGGRCLGRVKAGTYTTVEFNPKLSYTVPDGWFNYEDTPGNFLLVPPYGNLPGVNAGTSDFIGVYTSVAAEGHDCSAHTTADAPDTPAGIAGYVRRRHGLITTAPRPVTVGGLSGLEIQIRLAHGAGLHCPGYAPPYYPVIIGVGGTGLDHGMIPDLTMRLYLLEYAGAVLAVEVDDLAHGRRLSAYDRIVRRFQFSPVGGG